MAPKSCSPRLELLVKAVPMVQGANMINTQYGSVLSLGDEGSSVEKSADVEEKEGLDPMHGFLSVEKREESALSASKWRIIALLAAFFVALSTVWRTFVPRQNTVGSVEVEVWMKNPLNANIKSSEFSLQDSYIAAYNAGDSLESNCDCTNPYNYSAVNTCTDPSYLAYKGIDLVELWKKHSVDGLDYSSYTPEIGRTDYRANYGGYSLTFLSQENKEVFAADPGKYVPAWGGFCSLGIAAEFCNFGYYWDKECLGPMPSIDTWQYIEGKLYFFRSNVAMSVFNVYQDKMVETGNSRWAGWYTDSEIVVNTDCMYMNSSSLT